jgi:hypothetical protein
MSSKDQKIGIVSRDRGDDRFAHQAIDDVRFHGYAQAADTFAKFSRRS